MSPFRATIRDEVRQALGLGKFPVRPGLGATPAPTNPEPSGQPLPLERVTVPTDPILDYGYKLERFHQDQALAGVELEKLGRGIDNLADQVNLEAAKAAREHPGADVAPPASGERRPEPLPPRLPDPLGSRMLEPFNNPFSSIPGM